jgi:hypothetical protein
MIPRSGRAATLDLILHVGLSKTGTSTLQFKHFIDYPGYLGRDELLGKRNRDGGLYKLFLKRHRGMAVDLEPWRDKLVHLGRSHNLSRILASEENLSHWEFEGSSYYPISGRIGDQVRPARRGPHPIIEFVRSVIMPVWEPHGVVSVIVTLRNQFDWLGSRYAQSSKTILSASQSDFDRQVRRVVEGSDAYLDFAALVDGLDGAIGRERVTVLLLEEIHRPEYWAHLGLALGYDLRQPSGAPDRANRRSTSDGWELRPFARRFLLPALFGKQPTPLRPSEWTAEALQHPFEFVRVLLKQREQRITADPSLRELVQDRYRESNARLAERLGRELRSLGY